MGVVMRGLKWVGSFALLCAPGLVPAASVCDQYVQSQLERGLVKTESSGNEFAIGVVGGLLLRQPRNVEEAIATARSLDAKGFNFSVGCRQVNKTNFQRYGLTIQTAFDPKANSKAGAEIYRECLARATSAFGKGDAAVRAALSCYYSGNFITGQRKEGNQASYVDKVLRNAKTDRSSTAALAIPVIPSKPKGAKVVPIRPVSTGATTEVVAKAGDKKPTGWDVFNEL
jgi:type IV secretion system protein VirB1